MLLLSVDGTVEHCLDEVVLPRPIDPVRHVCSRYETTLGRWLRELAIELVEVRQLAHHSLDALETAARFDAPVVVWLDDYYGLCPSHRLIDNLGTACAGTCTDSSGSCGSQLWQHAKLPLLKHGWVHRWRSRNRSILQHATRIVVPTRRVAGQYATAFPELSDRLDVVPHEHDLSMHAPKLPDERRSHQARLHVLGAADHQRTLQLALGLLEQDTGGRLSITLPAEIPARSKHPRLLNRQTGRTRLTVEVPSNDCIEAALLLEHAVEPTLSRLHEAWAAGLPAVVLGKTDESELLTRRGGGWALPALEKHALHARLATTLFNATSYASQASAVGYWQMTRGNAWCSKATLSSYRLINRRALATSVQENPVDAVADTAAVDEDAIAVVCPTSSGDSVAPASTHIRIWARTRCSSHRRHTFYRCTAEQLVSGITAGRISRAVIQRNVLDSAKIDIVLAATKRGVFNYAYDIDDNLLEVPPEKDKKGVYARGAPNLSRIISSASVVTVSTCPLLKVLRDLNPRTQLLHNRLDDCLWRPVSETRFDREEGKIVLFYMGSTTHDEDLDLVLPAFTMAHKQLPNLRLRIVGGFADRSKRLPTGVEQIELPDASKNYPDFVNFLSELTREADFAICPLVDTTFNRCKSSLKLLEYAALALAGLYSDVNVYRSDADADRGSLLVENDVSAWANAILRAAARLQSTHAAGLKARDWVMRNGLISSEEDRYDRIIDLLAEPGPTELPAAA